MDKSLEQFNREIDDFTNNMIPDAIVTIQKKLVLEALRRVVLRTPVDTGRARGNWQTTIAEPSQAILDVTDKDGNATIQKGLAAIATLPPYQVVYITNNLEYIEVLEDGSSTQAPEGMVALTIQELREMFTEHRIVQSLKIRK